MTLTVLKLKFIIISHLKFYINGMKRKKYLVRTLIIILKFVIFTYFPIKNYNLYFY